jgi:hypothetical protein
MVFSLFKNSFGPALHVLEAEQGENLIKTYLFSSQIYHCQAISIILLEHGIGGFRDLGTKELRDWGSF